LGKNKHKQTYYLNDDDSSPARRPMSTLLLIRGPTPTPILQLSGGSSRPDRLVLLGWRVTPCPAFPSVRAWSSLDGDTRAFFASNDRTTTKFGEHLPAAGCGAVPSRAPRVGVRPVQRTVQDLARRACACCRSQSRAASLADHGTGVTRADLVFRTRRGVC